jgi:hypothetical protein
MRAAIDYVMYQRRVLWRALARPKMCVATSASACLAAATNLNLTF